MVDWKEFVELEKYEAGTPSKRAYDKMVDGLLDAGVLSLDSRNNYFISAAGMGVIPRDSRSLTPLHFTKEKDAEEYAEIKYFGAEFSVSVHKNSCQ